MKKFRFPIILCLVAIIMTGCSSSSSSVETLDSSSSVSTSSSTGFSSVTSVSVTSDDGLVSESYDYDSIETESTDETSESELESATDDSGEIEEEKLVYTCWLELESTEYDKAYAEIKNVIDEYDGFIEYESESNSNSYWYYSSTSSSDKRYLSLTVRIPSSCYSDFISGVSNIAKVMSKSSQVENITEEYYENENTIAALELELERLQEMMKIAETIDEMISVEERLTEVETTLSWAENKRSSYDSDVTYSTIYIELEEVYEYSSSEKEKSFGKKISDTFSNSIEDFIGVLQFLLLAVIYFAPYILALGVVGIIVVFVVKKLSKK